MTAHPAPRRDPAVEDADDLLTIGELARRSGLTASALRFYDRERVLVPADVDALTGYRRYAGAQVRAARLLASLRRVGMPLAEVALVLDEDARGASRVAADVVAAHEQRLVDGLADARREIRRTLELLAERGAGGQHGGRATVLAGDLVAALASVRFAVAPGAPVAGAPDGPDLTVLTGILLEVGEDEVRCVATDRYRLAVGWAPRHTGPGAAGPGAARDRRVSAVVPTEWADRVVEACAGLPADAEVALEAEPERVGLTVGAELLATGVVPGTFPDHRSFVAGHPRQGGADAAGLWSRLPGDVESVGLVVREGVAHVLAPSAGDADVHVDPEFLREALVVAGSRPTLVLDGPRRPLAVRGSGAGFSVLMPVAPDGLGS